MTSIKNQFLAVTRHPSSGQKAQSLLRGTRLTRPLSTVPNSDLSDSVGIDRSGWEVMLLYKVFSGRRTRVTAYKKKISWTRNQRERRARSWQCGPNLNDKVCTLALKPACPGCGVGVVDDEAAKGGEEDEDREWEEWEETGVGEEGEGRQGCPSFKHAGLNGTDSSDI